MYKIEKSDQPGGFYLAEKDGVTFLFDKEEVNNDLKVGVFGISDHGDMIHVDTFDFEFDGVLVSDIEEEIKQQIVTKH